MVMPVMQNDHLQKKKKNPCRHAFQHGMAIIDMDAATTHSREKKYQVLWVNLGLAS